MELFLAVGLTRNDAASLTSFARGTLSPHPAECPGDLHVTLHYLGETDRVNEIADRLSLAAYPAFSLKFAGLGAFHRENGDSDVIWQGLEDPAGHLAGLRKVLADALVEFGFEPMEPFTPHITLSYTKEAYDAAELKEIQSPLAGASWAVRSFQLWQVLPRGGSSDQADGKDASTSAEPGCGKSPSFRKIADYRLSPCTNRGQARILCVNDFHGSLGENSLDLGAAKLAAAVKAYCARHPGTAVVFGGDNCFGEPVSDLFSGKPVLDLMKLLGTSATVLGNHDLDSEVDVVSSWPSHGNVTLLAANLRDRRTGELPAFVRPWTLLDVNGFRIALIGLCTVEELPGPDHPQGWGAYELTDPVEAAKKWTARLRHTGAAEAPGSTQAPDAILALSHLGLKLMDGRTLNGAEAIRTALGVPELDGLFTAHFHSFLQLMIGSVPVAQGGSKGWGFSVFSLTFDEDRSLLSAVPLAYDLRGGREEFTGDPEMQRILARYEKAAEPTLSEVIFTASEDIPHRDMADFSLPLKGTKLTELALQVMRAATGCEVAMLYAGRVVGPGFRKGPVTLREFYRTYAFANTLVTTRMTGSQIRENVEIGLRTIAREGVSPLAVGGLIVTVDPEAPYRRRVLDIRHEDGSPLAGDELCDVVIEDYLATNPFGFRFPAGDALHYQNKNVRDLMLRYLREAKQVDNTYTGSVRKEGSAICRFDLTT